MSRFHVGQRVKKVRGITNIGTTGVVLKCRCHPEAIMRGFDASIRYDFEARDNDGRLYPAGTTFCSVSAQWEPILDTKHEACDDEFKRDLDELLERQGVAA